MFKWSESSVADVKMATELTFWFNSINDVERFTEALAENQRVKKLRLWFFVPITESVRTLTRALKKNKTVTTLFLCNNHGIGDEEAGILAEMLEENETLTHLRLSNCRVGVAGARALARAIGSNVTLRELLIDANPVGEEGALALIWALHRSWTLEALWFGGVVGGANYVQRLASAEMIMSTARQDMLPFMFLKEGASRDRPVTKFLNRDGDHAVAARVLMFLMPEYVT